MNPIQNCLKLASERKAQEILFHTHQPLRFRIGKEFVDLAATQVNTQDMRQFLAQILNEEERKSLYEQFKIQGVKTIGNVSFQFDFQIDFEGVNGSLTLQNAAQSSWNFSAIVNESPLKPQGLNLVIGPRRSGKTSAVQQIISAAEGRNKVIAAYSDMECPDLVSDGNLVLQFPVAQLKQNGVFKSADLVVIDSASLEFCEQAVRLAEEGRSVLLCLPFWNISMGLQRMVDLMEGTTESRVRRLASTLQMALGLRILPGLETPLQGAMELLLVDSEMQEALSQMDLARIGSLMRTTAERTGMRTLNHSLFQLLMKRKIELKTAFEASPSPEELDSLLKKVGI